MKITLFSYLPKNERNNCLIGQNIFRQFFERSKIKAICFWDFLPLLHSNSCTISFRIAKISLVWQQGLKLRWNIDVRFHLRLDFQIEDQLWLKTVWIVDMSNQNFPSCVWSISILYKLAKHCQIFCSLDKLKQLRRNDKWEQFPLPKEAGWRIIVDSEF